MEYHIQLELWRGNVAGAIQIARQRNELSDWIVAMAPLASHDLWELVSAEYAEQLEEDGQYHKAATYLLAAHKVHQAIDLFRRHRLFREAVSLAKIRLSPIDPLLEDLYTEWGQSLMKDGQFEQAAKCYLAMRHVQEAGKAITRRHDQSALRTACHMTLLANEKQQGLAYAYKIFTQHLMLGEWQEAYKFLGEHESLKVLLPLLSTHELLIQQLTSLCPSLTLTQKPVTSDMFSQWEKKEIPKSKSGLPEFLVDKSEVDPVVPWEPFLIGEHTFPHHVLRVWHQHLDVAMVTQDLKAMHTAISQLVSLRQVMADLPTTLLLVSVDMTLCLLALLISETSSAVNHLLQAMSTLQQSSHKPLLQAFCRLMLPQGPKYLLKLQQEFNASRVLITMESHGDVDKAGGENHSTIKKFLTDIKDDSAISMSSLRCRELDCLRAYYYLAVLDFFRDSFPGAQSDNDSHDGMPNGAMGSAEQSLARALSEGKEDSKSGTESKTGIESRTVENKSTSQTLHGDSSQTGVSQGDTTAVKRDSQKKGSDRNVADLDQNGKLSCPESPSSLPDVGTSLASKEDSAKVNSSSSGNGKGCDMKKTAHENVASSITSDTLNQNSQTMSQEPSTSAPLLSLPSLSSLPPVPKLSKTLPDSSSVDPPFVPSTSSSLKASPLRKAANDTSTLQANSSPSSPPQSPLKSPSSPPKSTTDSSGKTAGGSANKITKSSPKKKETSSPSHISVPKTHLNLSKLLRLSKGILWDVQAKREALTETLGYIHRAISQHLLANRSSNGSGQSDSREPGSASPGANVASRNFQLTVDGELEEDGGCHQGRLFPEASRNNLTISTCFTNESPKTSTLNSPSIERTRSLSPQPFGHADDTTRRGPMRSFSDNYSPCKSPLSPSSKLDHSLALQVEQELLGSFTSEPVGFQKSRKVLWMDGKETCAEVDTESAFQVSKKAPDGSSIPVEWDDLPVDIKYIQPYVTLPLLRQEQENIALELKRVPDASKIPFPLTGTSVRRLLDTSLSSPYLSKSEKHTYFKQLNDWATLFAITTQQQKETETLFAAAAAEYFSDL